MVVSVYVWRESAENSYWQVLINLLGLGRVQPGMVPFTRSAAIRGGRYAESSTRSDHDTDALLRAHATHRPYPFRARRGPSSLSMLGMRSGDRRAGVSRRTFRVIRAVRLSAASFNYRSMPLTISSTACSGLDPLAISVSNACLSTLPMAASCVTLAPG